MTPIGVPSRVRDGGARRLGWKGVFIGTLLVGGFGLGTSGVVAATPPDALVRVRVIDADGVPLRGARVIATVVSTSKADFDRFGNARSHVGRTNDDGILDLALRLDGRERAAVAWNGDWLNFSVAAIDAHENVVALTAATRYLGTDATERQKASQLVHHDVVRLRAAPGSSSTFASSGGTAESMAGTSCYYYWQLASTALRYAQVGELHVDYDASFARFTYGRTADTTFDVAVKSSAADWSIQGSVHIANSQDASVYANAGGQTNYHWALRTQFRFANYRLYKDCLGGPYGAFTGSEEWIALEWTGGGMTLANTLAQAARSAANTSNFGANTGWTRASSSLVKWKGAVSIFGVDVGAQSGASATVKIEYTFGSRPTHYLYGDTALPAASKRVFQDTP